MASGDRFYLLNLSHRPAVYGDIGSVLKVEGIVIGGEGAQAVLMLPSSELNPDTPSYNLSIEEWSDFLQRSDNPEVLVMPAKAFHRKCRYEISGAVQQKVWLADGLKCIFCKKPMGEVQLTIDHWVSLESGGSNEPSNYLSACRRCNKSKGSMLPEEFCRKNGLDFEEISEYLRNRKI